MTDAPLPDGTYDAIVVDADTRPDGGARLELAVLAGEHKGRVIVVSGPAGDDDPVDLLGVPATITVDGGTPRVRLGP